MGQEALLCPTPAAQLPPAPAPTGKSGGGPSLLSLPETAKSELSASLPPDSCGAQITETGKEGEKAPRYGGPSCPAQSSRPH